jgi:Kef-type K+ transport system membrane component KefB/nucleotide-binding universal stress UspA family protein
LPGQFSCHSVERVTLLHGPLPLLIAQAIVVVGLSRAVGLLARRMRQPMVIAEIVAGIMLGPSLLGWLAPSVSAALFPHDSLAVLQMLSQIGLILFMFLVGLEFDTGLLRGRGHTSVVISHTSIILPFGLGALIALYLYPRLAPPSVPFSSFTLFMGAAMSITAFPVLARILVERRLLKTKLGAVTITCAAVDDVTAWCILACVVSIVRASSAATGLITTALALVYIAVMLIVVRPFVRRLANRSTDREGLNQNIVAVTLMLVLLSSWATEIIGIHALFGAFIFGAIVPKENRFPQILADKLEDLVVVLLLPLFFAYSGLRTEIGLLDSPEAWLMCGLIIVTAVLGKFGGSAIAARVTGLRWREATALGILMNTRGLIELIVLNIGLDLGVISPALFTMMVLMALLTTFMTTPLLEWVYPMSEIERDEDEAVAVTATGGFTVLMCVAYDRSGPAMVTLAGALAHEPAAGDRLYALRLIRPTDRASFVLRQQEDAEDAGALIPLLTRAQRLKLEVRPMAFVSSQPAHDICNVASVKHADLVLLGWHKPIVGNTVLSGTVHDVMRRAETDVGVLIDRGLDRIENVLLPYLGTAHDTGALRLAHRLATFAGARVTVLHVVDPETGSEGREIESRVREAFIGVDRNAELKVIEHETAWRAAVEEAARGYDLVLIGAGAEWGLEHRPFGFHSEMIIRDCPTSLLVVRPYRSTAAFASPSRNVAAG